MSLIGPLFTAQTAINAFSEDLNIAGDNIANLNTVGFKTSRQSFADLLPTVDGSLEIGHGVRLGPTTQPFQQGAIENSGNDTDLAIQGNGYFILKNTAGDSYYTRAGQFQLDNNSNLANPSGLLLQGLGGNISLAGAETIPATPTSQLELNLNLDASAVSPTATFPGTGSVSQWMTASNFSTVTPVYDDAGNSHDLTFYFRKSAPNTWDYEVAANRSELDATAPTSQELTSVGAAGQLVFKPDGQPDLSLSTIPNVGSITWVDGATTHTSAGVAISFTHTETQTDPLGNPLTVVTGLTQYSGSSAASAIRQDGMDAGTLTKIKISPDGVVSAQYSNGQIRNLDTVALALFPNVDDLDRAGGTLFRTTLQSGAAIVGAAGTDGRGSLLSGSLELSTVDLAAEFVSLLTSQRSFQVNSKVITTADQMYAVAAELKPL